MFWTESISQLMLFDDPRIVSSDVVSRLIAFAQQEYPDADSNFHRQFAFLTHEATQNFLSSMLVCKYGSIDNAKQPTLDWLDAVGSFETLARRTRGGCAESDPCRLTKRSVPFWYGDYCKSSRFKDMKSQAEHWWRNYMGELTCSENARHEYQVMHHRDYGCLGQADEFRFLVPKCHECHSMIRLKGPAVPQSASDEVKKWL